MKPIRSLAKGGAAVLTAGALTIAGVGAASAGPSAKPTHGKEYVTLTVINNKTEAILHGLFVAYGTDVQGDDGDVLHLNGGTLTISHPEADGTYTYTEDPLTCYVTSTIQGKYTIGGGTGKYAGVTGSGTYKGSFEDVAKRLKSGACDEDSQPYAGVGVIHGSGPTTNTPSSGGSASS